MSKFVKQILFEAKLPPHVVKSFNTGAGDVSFKKFLHYYLPNAVFSEEQYNEAYEELDKYIPEAFEENFREEGELTTVNLEDLIYSQNTLNDEGTFTKGPIAVFKCNGKYYLFDGNHRVAEALINGQKQMPAYLIDLDKLRNA